MKLSEYIKNEIKAIALFAVCASQAALWFSAGWWWLKPPGYELLAMLGGFAVGALIGILASIHDDWKVSLRIERRRK